MLQNFKLPLCFKRHHQCLPSLFARVDEAGRFAKHRGLDRNRPDIKEKCTRCTYDLYEGSLDSRGEFYERLRFDHTYLDKWFSINANYRKNGYLEPCEINEIIDEILNLNKQDDVNVFAFLERDRFYISDEFSLLKARLEFLNLKGPKVVTIAASFIFVPTVLKLHDSLKYFLPSFDWAYADSIFNNPDLRLMELRFLGNDLDLDAENVEYEWIWTPNEDATDNDDSNVTDADVASNVRPTINDVRRSRLLITENKMLDYLFGIENYYHLYKTLPFQFVCSIFLVPSTKILRCSVLSKVNVAAASEEERELIKSCLTSQLQADLIDCFDVTKRNDSTDTIVDPSRLNSDALTSAWSSIPLYSFLRGFFNVLFALTRLTYLQSVNDESRERFIFSLATILHRRLTSSILEIDEKTRRFGQVFFLQVSKWDCAFASLLLPLSFLATRKLIVRARKNVLRTIRTETDFHGMLYNAQYRALDILDVVSSFRGLESQRKKINVPLRTESREKISKEMKDKNASSFSTAKIAIRLFFQLYLQEELRLVSTAKCDFFEPTSGILYNLWNCKNPPIQRYVVPGDDFSSVPVYNGTRAASSASSSSSSSSFATMSNLSFTGTYAYVPVSSSRGPTSWPPILAGNHSSTTNKRVKIKSSLIAYHPVKERSAFVKSVIYDILYDTTTTMAKNDGCGEILSRMNFCKTLYLRSIDSSRIGHRDNGFRVKYYLDRWRRWGFEVSLAKSDANYVDFIKNLLSRTTTL